MDSQQQFKLRKTIKELKSIRGRHTELVSVYIPAGYDMNKIIQHLSEEQGTASNIKDKTTRSNVIDSLEKMIRHLRLYGKTPEYGLVVFCGNIASQEGKQDLKVWSIEPSQPINIRMYRCDQTFVTEPLEGMLITKEVYGLLVLDNREATLGLLRGKSIQVIKQMGSAVPGKLKVGGFSQQRYARLRLEAANEFYKRIADVTNKELESIGKDLKGIIIGGPGPTKETFLNTDHLHNELKKKILGVKDVAYTDESGLHDLINRSNDLFSEAEIFKEKKLMGELFERLAKNSDKVTYGATEVKKALEMGAVDKLLLSEEFNGADDFEELALQFGSQFFIISTETKEGVQLKDLGGVAAILRYSIE